MHVHVFASTLYVQIVAHFLFFFRQIVFFIRTSNLKRTNRTIIRSEIQNVTDAKSENDNLHLPIIIKVDAFKTINMRIRVVGIRRIDNSVGHFELKKKNFDQRDTHIF